MADQMPEKMSQSNGHVTVNEHAPTEKFNRFVDEKVKAWVADHQGEEPQASEYEVAFFDEDTLGQVSCLVVIHCGGQLWRAWETGDNPRTALGRSLEQLAVDDEASASEGSVTTSPTVH
jgi:hypothetical protein